MKSSPIIDVIIPALNEENAIARVIREIPKSLVRQIIVCNNNSQDHTALYAQEAGATVIDQPRRGYGRACLTGIEYIKRQRGSLPPDIVVFLDGDYSDYPEEMINLIDPILEGKDLVIGTRVRGKYSPDSMTGPQIFGNWLATNLIKFCYGFKFTDLGPFRAIRWNKLLELKMEDPTYGWTVEMQVKALKQKLSCAEVAVSYRNRIGESKISGNLKGSILAGHKILWTIFKYL
ncbi:MAG TPA: glycosyltransferase family 2 protein [Saprospiraceae bacterium]|nr:glycosyltransferase family 2 protein [Saprospiraceae bacterium]